MKSRIVFALLFLAFSYGCKTTSYEKHRDFESDLLGAIGPKKEVSTMRFPTTAEFLTFDLHSARIEIPMSAVDSHPIGAYPKVKYDEIDEGFHLMISNEVLTGYWEGMLGFRINELEELFRTGNLRIYDKSNGTYLSRYDMAEYDLFDIPVYGIDGIAFLFPDSDRVLFYFVHRIT